MSSSSSSISRGSGGTSLKRWALASSLVCAISFLVVSVASFAIFSFLTSQEHVTTAEGNEPGVWNYARWTSIAVAVSFLLVSSASALVSYYLVVANVSDAAANRRRLDMAWIAVMILGATSLAGAGIGEWKAFASDTKANVESAW
ncbi:hypothetical protein JCM3766R1_003942 [Sporobolomyces carnicolor]